MTYLSDSSSDIARLLDLSAHRSVNVAIYLIKNGIPRTRLFAAGLGTFYNGDPKLNITDPDQITNPALRDIILKTYNQVIIRELNC